MVFQTDNGAEFVGPANMKKRKSPFVELIEDEFGLRHERIPPRCYTWVTHLRGGFGSNVLDDVRVVDIILGIDPPPTEYELWAADFNGDGHIDVLGVVTIVKCNCKLHSGIETHKRKK
ncbi:MAG: hypothetical protein ACE5OR_07540 [bacterium]